VNRLTKIGGVKMKRFSFVQVLLSLVIVASLAGAAYIYVPPAEPMDLESATGLTASQLTEVANSECQLYEEILTSSAAGTDYENWVTGMSDITSSRDAANFRLRNEAVYDFAEIDFSEKLRDQAALTLQALIVEDSNLSIFPPGKWNMDRLDEFYPKTFSSLSQDLANLTVKECNLSDLSKGMQQVTQLAKRVMILARTPSKSSSSNQTGGCAAVVATIGTVRTLFAQGTATPSETASILRGAASVWNGAASSETGSKASWLRKMSELSSSLSGYIMNGSPSNGDQLLSQLNNNFNLSTQFCD
jgi:hypothetical protein